jgi:hypothetical protein
VIRVLDDRKQLDELALHILDTLVDAPAIFSERLAELLSSIYSFCWLSFSTTDETYNGPQKMNQ